MRVTEQALIAIAKKFIFSALPVSRNNTLSTRLFRSYFFLSPDILADLCNALNQVHRELEVKHVLFALYYYKVNNTWEQSAIFFGIHKQTYVKYVQKNSRILYGFSFELVSSLSVLFIYFLHKLLTY